MNELDELEQWCEEKREVYKKLHIQYHDPYYFTQEIVYENTLERIAKIKSRRGDGDGNITKTVA